jgi:uncharacterized protein (TIGR02117 family)
MRILGRLFRWGSGSIGLFAALYLVAACVGAIWPKGGFVSGPPAIKRVFLFAGPIHYDVLIPIDDIGALGWLQAEGIALDHPNARYLAIGWGARTFYTTVGTYRDVHPAAIWKGIFGDDAVLRVTLVGELAEDSGLRTVPLDEWQLAALLTAINNSFSDGAGTQALDLPGFSEHDRFFPAKERFSLLNTCNVWIGRMIRASGKVFGRWTPTPFAVTLSLQLYG